jgi:hypothetical protein
LSAAAVGRDDFCPCSAELWHDGPMRRTRLALLFVFALQAALAGPVARVAHAQDATVCADRLTDDEVTYRLHHLERRFEAGKRRARAWWYSWFAFGVAAAGATWTFFAVSDRHSAQRDAGFASGVGSVALLTQLSAMPMTPAFAPQRLRRLPERTPAERRAKLDEAVRLLRLSASRQRRLRSIGSHLGPFVWAGINGTYLAVRYDDWFPTTVAFVAPPLFGELRILTLPHQAYDDYQDYRAWACAGVDEFDEYGGAADGLEASRPSVAWSVAPAPGGLGLRLAF